MAQTPQQLTCAIVTPEGPLLETPVDSVVVPAWDGELGILKGHAPLVGKLGLGELRVVEQGKTRRFYVEGGFLEVLKNVVTVLPNRAEPAEAIDPEAASRDLEAARSQPLAGAAEATEERQLALARAKARLQVAQRARS